MASASRLIRSIFLLTVGMLGGSILTYLGHAQGISPVFLSIGLLTLPFILAILTGAAKTTTV